MFRIVIERGSSIVEDRLFEGPFVAIGRGESNDVILDDSSVSANHLVLKANQDGTITAINQSAAGTTVGGRALSSIRIAGPTELEIPPFRLTVLPQPDRGQTTEASIPGADEDETTVVSEVPGDASPVTLPQRGSKVPGAAVVMRMAGETEKRIPLGMTAMVGRSHDADIELESPDVSRHHCTIFRRSGAFYLKRLSSVNPVLVNGRALAEGETRRLVHGDEIDVCGTILSFEASTAEHERIPDGGANLGMSVRASAGGKGAKTIEVIGFLGGKNVVAFDRELDQVGESVSVLTIDLGYLVGIDGGGIDALERAIRSTSMRGVTIAITGTPQRILDIIMTSPKRAVIEPHLGGVAAARGRR